MSITGEANSSPMKVGVAITDISTGVRLLLRSRQQGITVLCRTVRIQCDPGCFITSRSQGGDARRQKRRATHRFESL